jgi:hypothetical protein
VERTGQSAIARGMRILGARDTGLASPLADEMRGHAFIAAGIGRVPGEFASGGLAFASTDNR